MDGQSTGSVQDSMIFRQYVSTDANGRTVLHYDELANAALEVYNFLFDKAPDSERNKAMASMEAIVDWAEGEMNG